VYKRQDFEIKNLKFKVVFANNEEIKDYSASVHLIENSYMQITLTNFNNSLGTGLTVPFEVGHLNGRKLFLQFIVYTLGETGTKMFAYTWLIQKERA